mmetsp:Transcript_15190/g.47081  ORF Transcript_15190/g.47081 Transcript_15190/m.47081 type:complete len:225 (-) Transcript_15190:28-702(-)
MSSSSTATALSSRIKTADVHAACPTTAEKFFPIRPIAESFMRAFTAASFPPRGGCEVGAHLGTLAAATSSSVKLVSAASSSARSGLSTPGPPSARRLGNAIATEAVMSWNTPLAVTWAGTAVVGAPSSTKEAPSASSSRGRRRRRASRSFRADSAVSGTRVRGCSCARRRLPRTSWAPSSPSVSAFMLDTGSHDGGASWSPHCTRYSVAPVRGPVRRSSRSATA